MDINNMTTMVEAIIIDAYKTKASNIHIEPFASPKTALIRFRIDGVCQEYMEITDSMAASIVTKIKSMANLDIDECRLPQDGYIRFKQKHALEFNIRVATYPVDNSREDVVLKIMSRPELRELDNLAFSDQNLKLVKDTIQRPQGMFLVAGPIDSGKITTLHAILNQIKKNDVKVLTAEDPIKIKQWGIRQVEIKPLVGFDFARAIRTFLRSDPNVIMVGEMIDEETASLSIGAALSGLFILSALHSNSAVETVIRLLDMVVNPLNLSDAIQGVLGQRLVRKLCKHCQEEYHPTKSEFDEIVNEYGKKQFIHTEIQYNSDLILYQSVGCEKCFGTGYRGRVAIHELMEATPAIKSMIKKQANAKMIFKQAIKDGMLTLKQDGIMKVFQGLTAMAEVRRVCIN